MKTSLSAKLRGYVRIRIHGAQAERFLNELIAKRVDIWDIVRKPAGDIELYMLLPDALKLRPLLRETGCRMKTLERYGVPFSFDVWRHRSFFIAGLFLFVLGLYMLSSLVWTIDIKGKDRLSEDQVLSAARAEGIYPFQWSFRLNKLSEISKGIHNRLDDTSWVGVTKQGTKIVIHIVESTVPKSKALNNPRHLVAKVDAVVTQIIAEEGKVRVRPNTKVSKGTVLISGNVGTEQSWKQVAAKGTVRGLVWHEYEILSPLISKQKVYTGEMKERNYVQTGDRRLKVAGFGDIPYEHYEIIQELNEANWKWLSLPIGWVKERVMEVQFVAEERSEEDAVQIGLAQARADIQTRYGADVVFKLEKILHQKADNGKVLLKVLFEVEQSIAEEQPIIRNP